MYVCVSTALFKQKSRARTAENDVALYIKSSFIYPGVVLCFVEIMLRFVKKKKKRLDAILAAEDHFELCMSIHAS